MIRLLLSSRTVRGEGDAPVREARTVPVLGGEAAPSAAAKQ